MSFSGINRISCFPLKSAQPTEVRTLVLRGLPIMLGDDDSSFFKSCLVSTSVLKRDSSPTNDYTMVYWPSSHPIRVIIKYILALPSFIMGVNGEWNFEAPKIPSIHHKTVPHGFRGLINGLWNESMCLCKKISIFKTFNLRRNCNTSRSSKHLRYIIHHITCTFIVNWIWSTGSWIFYFIERPECEYILIFGWSIPLIYKCGQPFLCNVIYNAYFKKCIPNSLQEASTFA